MAKKSVTIDAASTAVTHSSGALRDHVTLFVKKAPHDPAGYLLYSTKVQRAGGELFEHKVSPSSAQVCRGLLALFALVTQQSSSSTERPTIRRTDQNDPHDVPFAMIAGLAGLQKDASRGDHWTNRAFGRFGDFILVDTSEGTAVLDGSPRNLEVHFELLEESSDQRDTGGIPVRMQPHEVREMLNRLFHESVSYPVMRKDSKGKPEVGYIHCPLRRDLYYSIEFVGADLARDRAAIVKKYPGQWGEVIHKFACEVIKDDERPPKYRYVKSHITFTRTVADLGGQFRVLLIRDPKFLQHYSSFENVIYREEMDIDDKQFRNVFRWLKEHASEAADQAHAFLHAYVGKEMCEETRVAIADVQNSETGGLAICFNLPEVERPWEPRTFHFVSALPMLRSVKHFPLHLAEETFGVSSFFDYSAADEDDIPEDLIVVPFAHAIKGHERTKVTREALSVRMSFNAHSLPAGEGAIVFWK